MCEKLFLGVLQTKAIHGIFRAGVVNGEYRMVMIAFFEECKNGQR